MKKRMVLVTALLALWAGAAMAAEPTAIEYPHLAKAPAISGSVVSVSDYHMVVNTHDGHQVTMAMDSRTLVPNDLAPGMVADVEFRLLDNGQYYATRVVPDRSRSGEQPQPASARDWSDEHDTGVETAEPAVYRNQITSENVSGGSAAGERDHDRVVAADARADEERGTLPQTASGQPLIALLGVLALSGGVAVLMARRRRSA